jgi:hypothetical protein
MAEIEPLDRAGVSAGAVFIWVHAHNEREASFQTRAAKAGAGGVRRRGGRRHQPPRRARAAHEDRGLLGRVLLSHDAGSITLASQAGSFGHARRCSPP